MWDFARGSMRTYLIFKEKARRFAEDREIQATLKEIGASNGPDPYGLRRYSKETSARLKDTSFDVDTLARKGLGYERLDQLVVDLLLGAR